MGGKRNRYLGALLLQAHYKSSVSLPDLDPVSSCREPQLRTLVTGKEEVTRSASYSAPAPTSSLRHGENLRQISVVLKGNGACSVLLWRKYVEFGEICHSEALRQKTVSFMPVGHRMQRRESLIKLSYCMQSGKERKNKSAASFLCVL